jgi:hypothetical protein
MRFAFCVVITAVLACAAQAQEQPKPPVIVDGWRYELTPPRIHMNVCKEAACAPGSRVSYIMYPPRPEYTFERYKAEREKVAAMMRERMKGVTYQIEPPTEAREGGLTVFQSRRQETYSDGRSLTVITSLILSAQMSVELISSAANPEAAAANYSLFAAPLILTATADKPVKVDRN